MNKFFKSKISLALLIVLTLVSVAFATTATFNWIAPSGLTSFIDQNGTVYPAVNGVIANVPVYDSAQLINAGFTKVPVYTVYSCGNSAGNVCANTNVSSNFVMAYGAVNLVSGTANVTIPIFPNSIACTVTDITAANKTFQVVAAANNAVLQINASNSTGDTFAYHCIGN